MEGSREGGRKGVRPIAPRKVLVVYVGACIHLQITIFSGMICNNFFLRIAMGFFAYTEIFTFSKQAFNESLDFCKCS